MISIWQDYPDSYRQKEIEEILRAVESGACVSVVGLSGSGKSNLLGFLANRGESPIEKLYLDANRIGTKDSSGFFKTVLTACGESHFEENLVEQLFTVLANKFSSGSGRLCLIIDRYDAFQDQQAKILSGQLRYLRDSFKYALTFVLGTRNPVDDDTEIAELFYGHTIFIGALSQEDARWSIESFASRNRIKWDEMIIDGIIDASKGYPSFLRGACEAVLAGCEASSDALKNHPAVRRRLDEFISSNPSKELLEKCGLADHPWLATVDTSDDLTQLTAQEYRLFSCLKAHHGEVCSKDDLIKAIWNEDKIYGQGLRDDSLAQLIRRLREKIEMDPSNPQKIQTIAGRGFIYKG